MRSRAALGLSLLFVLSGVTALIYQLLWVRVLYQSFGSTIQSVTTVVAAYMGGLGLGAWLLGRLADRHPRPAALYGWLEIAIGLFGVASPLVFALAHRVWIAAAGSLGLGGTASVALRFGLAALVLFIPTTLMGGTLPVLTRAFTGGERAALRAQLGKLYGLNTLGAMAGTAVAGFFLIEHVGIRASLWLTAAINVALGVGAILLARPLAPVAAVLEPAPRAPTPEPRSALRTAAIVLLAVTAFAGLLDEIAWTRVLVMIVGGSTYAFTLVLLVFLLGIGVGSALVARRGALAADTAASAALAQGVAAAGAALLLVFFTLLPVYIVKVFQLPSIGPTGRLALLGGAVGLVVLLPAIGMGMTFPLLTDLVAGRQEARAADVGRAYALNTIGSIAGAALTGFVLVIVLGSDRTLRAGVLISAAASLTLAFVGARGVLEGSTEHRRLRTRVLAAGGLAAFALMAALAAPRWDTRLIDLGPTIYGRSIHDKASLEAFLAHRGSRQLAFQEGRNATVSVWESQAGRSLKVNGKADASDQGDMDTQIMLGLAPAAARSGAGSALVIGHGSGVTARVLAEVPGMREVRVVELEPAVLAVDSLFRHVNGNVLSRPNVRTVVDDARSALQLERRRFDVIVSEPSNPWVAGIATLYTPEFFRIARSRLSDDGVFCQWIQLYQLPLNVVAGIVRNLQSVFPHVEVWIGARHDLVVLASPKAFEYDRAWIGALVGTGAPLAELGREWLGMDAPEDLFGRYLFGQRGVAELVRRADLVHTDDHPRLEFVAGRRFLDREGPVGTLDSLILFGALDGRQSPALLAKALATRRGDPASRPYIDAMRRAHPADPDWAVRAALIAIGTGDTASADSMLDAVLRRTQHPSALLVSGLVAVTRKQAPRAGRLLRAALAVGADTGGARAGLAVLAARDRRWADAVVEVRASIAATRGTFRHPFAREYLSDALTPLTLDGPADTVLTLLAAVDRARPGWARLHELMGVAAIRAGRCDAAGESFLRLLDFGVVREDGPMLVERCRRGSRDPKL
ncbi:MAG TPA: fused MFS/spermidine synthase [Gemmatimonadales bacterium]